jgi:hypothetical protein
LLLSQVVRCVSGLGLQRNKRDSDTGVLGTSWGLLLRLSRSSSCGNIGLRIDWRGRAGSFERRSLICRRCGLLIGNLRSEGGSVLGRLGLLVRRSRRSLCVGRSLLLRLRLLLLLVVLLLLLARRTDGLGREMSGWALREALSWRREPAWRRGTVELGRRSVGEAVRTSGRTEARVALRRWRVTVWRERWGLLRALRTLRTAPLLLLLLLLLLIGLGEGALRTRWGSLRSTGCAVGSCGLHETMSASSLVLEGRRGVVMYGSEGRQRKVSTWFCALGK